jgi:hypothetical protein
MINNLAQLRFHGFEINKDYISNPTYIHRNSTNTTHSRMIMTQETVNYINTLTSTVYSNYTNHIFTFPTEKINDDLLQYVTSQAMAASCITNVMGKLKSVIARTAEIKNKIKNACMRGINVLLGGGTIKKKDRNTASGWSILKFSGDSSHIVYGDIIEKAIAYQDNLNIKVIYLVSERPLAGRILTKQKDIIIYATNVFIKKFIGPGSNKKNERHAALHVTFDVKTSYNNLVESIKVKINYVLENRDKFTNTIKVLDNNDPPVLDKTTIISKLIGSPSLGDNDTYQEAITNLNKNDELTNFLENYDKDVLIDEYNQYIQDLNFEDFAKNFIGKSFLSVRIGRSAQWSNLINNLRSRENNKPHDKYINQYDEFNKLISLIITLGTKYDYFSDSSNKKYLRDQLNESGSFKAIYKKIANSYYPVDKDNNNYYSEKYNKFEEERISEWLRIQKSNNGKISNDVQLIINQTQEFIDQVISLYKLFRDKQLEIDLAGGADIEIEEEDVTDVLHELKNNLLSVHFEEYQEITENREKKGEFYLDDSYILINKGTYISPYPFKSQEIISNFRDNSVVNYLNKFINICNEDIEVSNLSKKNRIEIYDGISNIITEKCFMDLITLTNEDISELDATDKGSIDVIIKTYSIIHNSLLGIKEGRTFSGPIYEKIQDYIEDDLLIYNDGSTKINIEDKLNQIKKIYELLNDESQTGGATLKELVEGNTIISYSREGITYVGTLIKINSSKRTIKGKKSVKYDITIDLCNTGNLKEINDVRLGGIYIYDSLPSNYSQSDGSDSGPTPDQKRTWGQWSIEKGAKLGANTYSGLANAVCLVKWGAKGLIRTCLWINQNDLGLVKTYYIELYNITFHEDPQEHIKNLVEFLGKIKTIYESLFNKDGMTNALKIYNSLKTIIEFNKFYAKNEFLFSDDNNKLTTLYNSLNYAKILRGGKKKKLTRKRKIVRKRKITRKRRTIKNKKHYTKKNKRKLKIGNSRKYRK